VNQVLFERAMETFVDRPVYDDVEHHRVYRESEERVYREAELEVDARNWRRSMLAARHPSPRPSLEVMLH
jgi:hypothetical protein